ncbi:type I polyketide synthase, partial [Streptomyces formicae]
SWEVFERAGIDPGLLRGSATGVFAGVMHHDYGTTSDQPEGLEGYAVTSTQGSVASGRIAYTFGFEGPAVTVDTACSSSLVALHLAVQALRTGECSMAIAGGVTVMATPWVFVEFSRQRGMAVDGRCKAFSSSADGAGWSEGVGLLLVERLSDARRNGHPVLAVIRGSAVNQDGASNGLTAPNGPSQQRVIRAALANAGLEASEVDAVEAHGTGTTLGDPIEAQALLATYGQGRSEDRPLRLGSVKSNIGHTQAAAGVAGVIKMVEAMRHRELPRTLHVDEPTSHVDWASGGVELLTESVEWSADDRPRRAGISAFGISGTNAHVVIEEADEQPPAGAPATETPLRTTLLPWLTSAKSEVALREQAGRLAAFVGERPELSVVDVGFSSVSSRAGLESRGVVLAADREGALAGLEALERGEVAAGVVSGVAASEPGRVAFVFPGQGSQWVGMAAGLLESSPVFAGRLGECDAALEPYVDWSVVDVVRGGEGAPSLDDVVVVQCALWAVMVSLAELWRSVGVEPAAVIGHSQGEIAAAAVAGALSLEDAAKVVALRARAISVGLSGLGGMMSIALPAEEVRERIASFGERVSVASVNGPSSTVVSGDPDALDELLSSCEADGVRARRIAVDYASHSAQVEQIREQVISALQGIEPRAAEVPFYSTVTGSVIDTSELDAEYWFTNLRQEVRFDQTVRSLLTDGFEAFVECSAHPVLTVGLGETFEDTGSTTAYAQGTLRRDEGGPERFLTSAAEGYVRGLPVNWQTLHAGSGARRVDLPAYAFQRKRYWIDSVVTPADAAASPRRQIVVEGGEAEAALAEEPLSGLRAELARLSPAEQRGRVLRLVRTYAAAALGHASSDAVDPETTFKDLGFDSHLSVQLRNTLNDGTELTLPATVLFEYPTPDRLAEHLHGVLMEHGSATPLAVDGARAADEPIAIVSMACRFPGGVATPEALWDVIAGERDVISDFPDDRGWDLENLYDPQLERRGTSYVRMGGFLDGATEFDPAFFGISPREALAMDPQQRLLLETSWEAAERAGINPQSLRGTRTGVFFGAMFQEYGPQLQDGAEGVDGHRLTGGTTSVASGRVAYTLGLEGPAITVDTACSSSLVALHWAVRSLRAGECSMALAGGVTIMSTPGMFVELSRQGALSKDGRCKPFSASADGTGWAEGVGTLLVERLSDARRNGHQVLAVIRGSATNQDGASNGLTAPHGPSQQRVIHAALADAGMSAADVDVVEAHGTGTALGDPIEAQALLATYGQERPAERPLRLGSVKSNIGHTQAAAGVAGVIKMVLAMRHGTLPTSLHVDAPSPHIDWSSGAVELLTEPVEWVRGDRPRRAGVSSFGISGTNAHLIIEDAPADPDLLTEATPVIEGEGEDGDDDRGLAAASGRVPWIVSAKTRDALLAQAERLTAFVGERPELSSAATGRALATSRAHLEHRAVILADDREAALSGLSALARELPEPGLVTGPADIRGGTAFVFPGQGSQWESMAVELLDGSPVFARCFAECELALRAHVEWSPEGVLRGAAGAPSLGRIEVLQPVLFAVHVALAGLWRSVGVEPAAVVGHSQGEIAAACVAGALSLEDAARIVVLRSALFAEELVGRGGVASVALSADEVEARLGRWDGRLSLAGRNGPGAATVAGDTDALEEFVAECQARDVRARVIGSTVASHCAQVDRLREWILELFADVRPRRSEVPFYSTVTGGLVDTEDLDASYWFENCRRPVDFEGAVRSLLADGFRYFVESSAHPVLTMGVTATCEDAGVEAVAVGSLRRDEGGPGRFLTSLAEGYVRGLPVDWEAVLAGADAGRGADTADDDVRVDLPTYAFQRDRYWLETARATHADPAGLGLEAAEHPLLGASVHVAGGGELLFTGRVGLKSHPWLADHAALDTVLLPGTGFVELALRAAESVGCDRLDELTLEAPLILPEDGAVQLQVTVGTPDGSGAREVTIHSRADEMAGVGGAWTRHAVGVLAAVGGAAGEGLRAWPPVGAERVDVGSFYERVADVGYGYGPAF